MSKTHAGSDQTNEHPINQQYYRIYKQLTNNSPIDKDSNHEALEKLIAYRDDYISLYDTANEAFGITKNQILERFIHLINDL